MSTRTPDTPSALLLSSLFGGGVDEELALTAVGDPIQSIYGWRGASATNLPRFTTDFPLPDGSPAPVLELRTSWRNPPSGPARGQRGLGGGATTIGGGACASLPPRRRTRHGALRAAARRAGRTGVDRRSPAAALPAGGRRRHRAADRGGSVAPQRRCGTDRRRAARPRRPGGGGRAGRSALRPRGGRRGRDAALGRRPDGRCGRHAGAHRSALAARRPRRRGAVAARGRPRRCACGAAPPKRPSRSPSRPARRPIPRAWPTPSPIPGPAVGYSAEGYRRIGALADELSALRGHLGHPLPDLVAEVRRVLGVDCEVRAAPPGAGWAGTEHLDAFADVVTGYAERAAARPIPCLGRGAAGLPGCGGGGRERPGASPDRRRPQPRASADRARRQGFGMAGGGRGAPVGRDVPVDRVRPAPGSPTPPSCRRCCAATGPPRACTASRCWTPQTSPIESSCRTRSPQHRRQLEQRRLDEERRLLYVAITRVRGHPAGVRPPLGGHRHQAARPVGFSVRAQGHHRPVGRGRPSPVARSSSGRPPRPTVNETRCVTTFSKQSGRSIRWPVDAPM